MSMAVKAKFKVIEVAQTEYGERIKLMPVTTGSVENQEFYKWTPSGQIELATVNANAAKQFEVGVEFYVYFEKAE